MKQTNINKQQINKQQNNEKIRKKREAKIYAN